MSVELNFEGFRDLIQRVAVQWYALAKKEFGADMAVVDAYLAKNPFTAEQSTDNEAAYEKLMDIRCKLFVSFFCSILFFQKLFYVKFPKNRKSNLYR